MSGVTINDKNKFANIFLQVIIVVISDNMKNVMPILKKQLTHRKFGIYKVYKKPTRNQRYERRLKAKGMKKITLWIPEGTEPEFKQMAEFCCENDDHIPFMARSLSTGKLKKGVD